MLAGFLLAAAAVTALWAARREGRRLQAERDRHHIEWAQKLPTMVEAQWEGEPLTRRQQQLARAYASARHRPVAVDRRAGGDFIQEVLFG